MYTYRESIVLGTTNFSIFKVNQILRELSREWLGSSYDLLSKNCNHFCDEFCERLGVPKLPGNHSFAYVNMDPYPVKLVDKLARHLVCECRLHFTLLAYGAAPICFIVGLLLLFSVSHFTNVLFDFPPLFLCCFSDLIDLP